MHAQPAGNTTTATQQLSRLETEANPNAVAFSPDGRLLATGDTGGLVSIWNSQDGALLGRTKTGDASIGRLAFTPDGHRLAAGTTGIAIIDLQAHQKLLEIPADDSVWHLEFSPDGKRMAICTTVGQICICDGTNEPMHEGKGGESAPGDH